MENEAKRAVTIRCIKTALEGWRKGGTWSQYRADDGEVSSGAHFLRISRRDSRITSQEWARNKSSGEREGGIIAVVVRREIIFPRAAEPRCENVMRKRRQLNRSIETRFTLDSLAPFFFFSNRGSIVSAFVSLLLTSRSSDLRDGEEWISENIPSFCDREQERREERNGDFNLRVKSLPTRFCFARTRRHDRVRGDTVRDEARLEAR